MDKRKVNQIRGKYTTEFKLEAVRLVKGGQAVPVTAKVLGMPCQTLGKWVRLSESGHLIGAGDKLVSASDMTYIRTDEGWLFLVAVIDLFSRQVVGWSMRSDMQAIGTLDALRMAWFRRRPAAGLIFHSDRGSQYCSHDFQRLLKDYDMLSSMSGKGDCWDNAPTESLWGRLKVGRLYGRRFATRRQAMDEVIDWLTFYNHKRLHSTLGYVSPMTSEQRWLAARQPDRKSA